MNGLNAFIHRFSSALLKLALALAAAVFLISLLLAALVVVSAVTLWSLLTGRKPAPARIFGQFRRASQRYTSRTWPAGSGPSGSGKSAGGAPDVVDVHAREVPPSQEGNGKAGSNDPPSGPMPRMQL